MKKILSLGLVIIILTTVTTGSNVYGDHFVDADTTLKVQLINENIYDDWNKVVLKGHEDSDKLVTDGGITSFSMSPSAINDINHHILKGDSIYFRLKLDYRKIDDGYLAFNFKINDSSRFESAGYSDDSNDGLEYFPGSTNTTVAGIYIDHTTTDGKVQNNESFTASQVAGFEVQNTNISTLEVDFTARGGGNDDWEIKYLELQYRILDVTSPEITSDKTYNPDTLTYNLSTNEPIVEYSINNGNNWVVLDNPNTSTTITLIKGLNEIKVKDQAGNISNLLSFYANTIEIINTFDAYSKIYDGTDNVDIYNDSTTIAGIHTGHDVSLNKSFSFSDADIGDNKVVSLNNSILTGVDADRYFLRLDNAPKTIAGIYDNISWDFESDFSNSQNNPTYNYTSIGSTGTALLGQYEGRDSVKFERENEQYLITNNENNLIPAGSDFTYSVWYYVDEAIKTIKNNEDPSERYFVIESSGSNYPISYGLKYDGNTLKGEVFTNNEADPNSFFLDNSSGSYGADTDRWYNITVTYDSATNIHTAYLNGVESSTMEVPVVKNIEKLILGSYRGKNDRFWDGYIDNLSIWGRVLEQSEIDDLQDYNMYTISFDGNGSTSGNSPSDELYEYGTTFNIPTDSELSRDGYVFTGWNTKADGSGTDYQAGDSIFINNNLTLYAQWDFIGEFKVSDYGTGQDTTYRWYRGYLFQVNQETVVTSLIGGGNGGVFAGTIYSVDGFTVNTDESISGNINPTGVLRSVEFSGENPNQLVKLDSELTLQPDIYYLIASGRKSWEGLSDKEDPNYGYGYVVKNIDVNDLESESTIINTWLPKNTGTSNTAIQYKYFDVDPASILNKTHTITEDLPMLGFQYITNVNLPEVETNSPDVTTTNAVLMGKLTSTGGGDTGVYFEIGTSADLSIDVSLYKVSSLTSSSNFSYTFNSLTEDKYYYRAVAVNEAGRSEGDMKSFYKPYNITYNLDGGTNSNVNPSTYNIDDNISFQEPTKEGYTFLGWYDSEVGGNMVESISKGSSGDLYLYAHWTTNTYSIIYNTNGGSSIPSETVSYGDNLIDYQLSTNTNKAGYTFQSWTPSLPETMPAEDITVNAQWLANEDTNYKVEHYQQNLNDDGYTLFDTENFTGTTNTDATAAAIAYTGFNENTAYSNRVESDIIEGDGSTVLRLYYDREEYTVTFEDYNDRILSTQQIKYEDNAIEPTDFGRTGYTFTGWDIDFSNVTEDLTTTAQYSINQYTIKFDTGGGSTVEDITQDYDTAITPPEEPAKAGYSFGGWSPSMPTTMPSEDMTLLAAWIPEGETKYTVEHYHQNVNDDEYTLTDTNILSGETDSVATTGAISYEGFFYDEDNSLNITEGSIKGDGTLVLKLYYNREEYTVTFLSHDDEVLKTEEVRYQGSANPPARPARSGYDFRKWSEDYTYITEDLITKARYTKEEPEPIVQEIIINVNGEEEILGTETSLEVDGEMTVTYEVEEDTVEKIVKSIEGNEEKILEIPIKTINPDRVTSKLTGDIVKRLEDEKFNINIKTDSTEYELPAEEITITKVSKQLGVEENSLEKIEVSIEINKASSSEERQAVLRGREEGYRVLTTPIEFTVKAKTTSNTGEEKEVEIKEFKKYVKRILLIPEDIDPKNITTAVLIEKNGNVTHIPTEVYELEGKWYAKINSLTNSQYTLINNEKEVKGVENHWAKEAVEDLASRKVIEDTEYFLPDASITRGKFAEYITKALGIHREEVEILEKFIDVKDNDEISTAVYTASKYGIINGYPDGSFKPEDKITREEAMVMYARAMEILELNRIEENKIENYKDKEAISDWAFNEVKSTIEAGVFIGKTSEDIEPKSSLTYGEAATAVRNLLVEAGLINE
ncbi:MAG: InlB B-repeat-containing protein [Bacillota bacterium]|nr:InlB B-repeat-containing protein [Bacillota bacterium]